MSKTREELVAAVHEIRVFVDDARLLLKCCGIALGELMRSFPQEEASENTAITPQLLSESEPATPPILR